MTDQSDDPAETEKPFWSLLFTGGAPEGSYDATFGGPFITEIANLCGKNADRDSLKAGLASAIAAFLSGKYDEEHHQSEKAENAALDRVARSANDLHIALVELYDFGQSRDKLVAQINRYKQRREGSSERILVSLLRDHTHPLSLLQDLATDLAIAAESAINRKPKIMPWNDPLNNEFAFEICPEDLALQTDEWRRRSAAHRLQPSHSVVVFLEAFRPVWEQNSDHPFTVGMHYTEAGSTVSYAVDAAHLILQKLDPALARSTVVTGIKNLRRQPRKDMNS
jgi:hypothetical protein